MIFVTIGTECFSFDRILEYIDHALQKNHIDEKIIYQKGSSHYTPAHGEVEKFLPFSQVKQYIQDAKLVITHGGVGSVNLCLSLGKKPVVCPRKGSLEEAIDDHQILYARYMAKHGYIHLVESEDEMEEKILDALDENQKHLFENKLGQSPEKIRLFSFLESIS